MPMVLVAAAVLLVLIMAWRGWRLGIVRQALSIVALGLGYAGGALFGKYLVPVLRPLGFPDRVLSVFGAVILGMAVYIAIAILGGLLFKRTSQQSVGVVRYGFGISGAVLGAAFGLFLVAVSAIGIRLLGSLADAETHRGRHAPAPSALTTRLASMKRSLVDGPAGALMDRVDPVPGKVYDTLGKVGQLAASPDSIERFANDRSVQHVAAHPKVLALHDDPEIARAIRDGDFFSLLRHPKVIAAANDPEVIKLLSNFDLQKALDHAVPQPQKASAR